MPSGNNARQLGFNDKRPKPSDLGRFNTKKPMFGSPKQAAHKIKQAAHITNLTYF